MHQMVLYPHDVITTVVRSDPQIVVERRPLEAELSPPADSVQFQMFLVKTWITHFSLLESESRVHDPGPAAGERRLVIESEDG